MREADLAITSCGLNVWELMYLKTPNLVISTSDREKITAAAVEEHGKIEYLGHGEMPADFSSRVFSYLNDIDLRQQLVAGESSMDGNGIQRLYEQVMDFVNDEA